MQICCVITGASSGLGRELALQYAAAGWQVLAIARSTERLAQLCQQSPLIQSLVLDLTDSHAVAQSAVQINARLPSVDLLIYKLSYSVSLWAKNILNRFNAPSHPLLPGKFSK